MTLRKKTLRDTIIADLKVIQNAARVMGNMEGQINLRYSGFSVSIFSGVLDMVEKAVPFERYRHNFQIAPGLSVNILLD